MPTITIPSVNQTRLLSGTTHYITEYILMIMSLASFVTSVVLMVFSICNLLSAGDVAGISAGSALTAAVGFLVFGPLYYALAKRVRSQELKEPATTTHKARTVFFVLASISAFGWFTGFTVTSVYFLLSPLVSSDASMSYGDNFVNVFLPAVISAGIIAAAYVSLAKSASTRYVAKFGSVALLVGLLLAIASVSIAVNKKNTKPTLKTGEKCTYQNYSKNKCTYDDYEKYQDELYPSTRRSTPTSKYDDYQDDTDLDSIYDY